MKICIVSDSHDRAEPLAAAVAKAQSDGAQAVIHCGDLIGANTLRAPSISVCLCTWYTATISAMQ
ncbi:MAG: metallophosphoesterase family protein [Gallionella sp.]